MLLQLMLLATSLGIMSSTTDNDGADFTHEAEYFFFGQKSLAEFPLFSIIDIGRMTCKQASNQCAVRSALGRNADWAAK